MRVNVLMEDGTELKDVSIFKNKNLEESVITNKLGISELFNGNKSVFFSGMYVEGIIIPNKIQEYEIIDNDKDLSSSLLKFVRDNQDMYDINIPDVVDFIKRNQDGLMRVLKYN